MTRHIFFLFLLLIIFTASPASAVLNITKDGDLEATEFDELGFDTTGLVGYWQLNGNAQDSSGQGNNGTIVGATATTDRFGTVNMALAFDGSAYVIIPNATSLNPGNQFTLVAWCFLDSLPTTSVIAEKNVYGQADEYGLVLSGNSNFGVSFQANNSSFYSNRVFPTGRWVHVVGTLSGNSGKYYEDGVLVASGNITAPVSGTGVLNIGRRPGVGYYFNGSIDEVKIFNRALTAAEILSMYNHEKGKFSVGKDGTMKALEFVEDPTLPVQMRSKKESLTVKGQLIEP